MFSGNYINNGSVIVNGRKVYKSGKYLPDAPTSGKSVTVINGDVFIDGYEFVRGKWRRTLRAIFHLFF